MMIRFFRIIKALNEKAKICEQHVNEFNPIFSKQISDAVLSISHLHYHPIYIQTSYMNYLNVFVC